jgi:hypothetical protein
MSMAICGLCRGQKTCRSCDGKGTFSTGQRCPSCDGTKNYNACHGTGKA